MTICDLVTERFETGGGVVYAIDAGCRIIEFVKVQVERTDIDVFLLFEDIVCLLVGCRICGFQTERDPPEFLICFCGIAYS